MCLVAPIGTDVELSVTTAAGEGWSTAQRLCQLYHPRLASPQLALNQAQYMPSPRVSTGGYRYQEKDVVLEVVLYDIVVTLGISYITT